MGMFNFVLDAFKGEIFDFKVDRRVLVASTVWDISKLNWVPMASFSTFSMEAL